MKRRIPIYIKICMLVLALDMLMIIFGSIFSADLITVNATEGKLKMFTDGHVLGTDKLGRDVLGLLVAGAANALIGPTVIAIGSLVIGLALGSISAWYRGPIDWIISRYTDVTLSLPSMLLAIVAAGIIGGGYWVSVLVMIVLYSPFDIRLVRSAVIAQKAKPYIESALVLRLSSVKILASHIFPNISMLVFVNFFLNIAYALVSMSSLSYLGIGVGPGEADWGRQLSDARAVLFDNPAALVTPALAIIITAVTINAVGNYFAEEHALQ